MTENKAKIIVSFPAYTIVSPAHNKLRHGESIMVEFDAIRGGTIWREFKVGTVASYAIEYFECPIKAVERAKANGHELHYAFGMGVSITSHKRDHEIKKGFRFGDEIILEGYVFEIVKAPNSNIALKMVREA
uniref:Uncharacterized protein n=1 Tax=Rhizobium phage IG49 TaxID=3129228 RepID=A0AAU8HYA3_9CAUD